LTSQKILLRSSQGNPSVGGGGGLKARGVAKYSDFGPMEGYLGNGAGGKLVLITNRKWYQTR